MPRLDRTHRKFVMDYITETIKLRQSINSIADLVYETGLKRSFLKEVMIKENPVLYGELCQMVDLELPITKDMLSFLDNKNTKYQELKRGLGPKVKFTMFVDACREYDDVKDTELVKIARKLNISRRTAYNYLTTLKREYKKHV